MKNLEFYLQKIKCWLGKHIWYHYYVIDSKANHLHVQECLYCGKIETKEIQTIS